MNRTMASMAALALLGAAAPAQAQGGTITSGDASFAITYYNTAYAADSDLYASSAGDDHLFAAWWWYRLPGDTDERILPEPDTETWTGDTATLSWTNVDATGLNVTLVITIASSVSGAATLTQTLTITNPGASATTIDVFGYADIELDDTSGGDSGSLVSPTELLVTETTTARFIGTGASAYQVAEYSDVEDLFSDTFVTALDNSGLPFAPGDWTGAFQWATTVGSGGGTASFTMTIEVVEAATPGDAGVPLDAGALPDAGISLDAGPGPSDAGPAGDAGSPIVDAGTPPDGGAPSDAGGSDDAGTTPMVDAGTTPTPDAGPISMMDAGTIPGVDAGGGPPPTRGGCGCRVPDTRSSRPLGALGALLVVGALVIRRRRR